MNLINTFEELENSAGTEKQQFVIDSLKGLAPHSVVVWGTQATIDYTYRISSDILAEIAKNYLSLFGRGIGKTGNKGWIDNSLKKISEAGGLDSDIEILVDGRKLHDEIIRLMAEENISKIKVGKPNVEIGGSPAISAITSYLIQGEIPGFTTLYAGTYPDSVRAHIESERNDLKPLFEVGVRNKYLPGTLSFESGKHKLMISNADGRRVQDIIEDGTYKIDLEKIASKAKGGNLVFAFGGLNKGKPEDYIQLINWIKGKLPTAYIFVGTSSFNKQVETKDYHAIRGYFEVLRLADIVSMNEAELDQIHEGVYNKKQYSRVEKLSQLNLPGISITHSPEGAIACFGTKTWPSCGRKRLLEGILQLAVDSTTGFYEKGNQLNSFDEMIDYSLEMGNRRDDIGFARIFSQGGGEFNISGVAAPLVEERTAKGNITGIGARFDGYAVALMVPLAKYMIGG